MCINFVNLSTAQSANRAKEVGLRKVLGSGRNKLVAQFLTESVLVALIAFGFGMLIAYLLLPYFNTLANKNLQIPFSAPSFLPIFLTVGVVIGISAGIYPSFYLSAFSPIKVLQGKMRLGSKSTGLRSSLVVFQFTVSAILLVGTIIINNQMNYILNKEVGFKKDQVILLHGTNMLGEQVETFKNELKQLPSVVNVTISDYLPIEGTKRNGNSFWNEGKVNVDERVGGQAWVIDEDYLNTLGMNLVEGRNFSKNRSSDQQSVIINSEMAQQLALNDPIGKKISRGGEQLYEIIGIVENFHSRHLERKLDPCAFSAVLAHRSCRSKYKPETWLASWKTSKKNGSSLIQILISVTLLWISPLRRCMIM
ncbi:MAG: FtsX-like permease family protein [Saprospiraceae bacterium]|nr:FtsX-like permease family protein [Saprospiraceae bacterium]